MTDPTYDREQINKHPVWRIAFGLSECLNDGAPLGWSRYIWVAEALISQGDLDPYCQSATLRQRTTQGDAP
jgi:hypothetical protein